MHLVFLSVFSGSSIASLFPMLLYSFYKVETDTTGLVIVKHCICTPLVKTSSRLDETSRFWRKKKGRGEKKKKVENV